jgi:transcription initiation factor TFIIIB Brf1 subunit/transcription initiation factor TFIIB
MGVKRVKYDQIKNYADAQFRRITGVKRPTFEKMLEILSMAHIEKHRRRGRNPKLCMEDRLLAALEYWREYRTFAHIAASYGVSESSIFKTIRWIEDVLIKDGTFSLPGKKALLNKENEYETAQIDATETPVERPKRGNENGTQGRKSGTR